MNYWAYRLFNSLKGGGSQIEKEILDRYGNGFWDGLLTKDEKLPKHIEHNSATCV